MPAWGGGRRRRLNGATAIALAAAGIGAAMGLMEACSTAALGGGIDHIGPTVTGCRVTDGDTIRCGDERIRLLGIDAPELPGHCRQGRICAPGDPYASSASLADAMSSTMRVERVGTDRYGRTLAMVSGPRGDLSCWQLAHRQAAYKPAWDDGGRVAQLCPSNAQKQLVD